MPSVHPYLRFDGNCREAFAHYRSIFGGEYIGGISIYADAPAHPDFPPLTPAQQQLVMHMALPIGPNTHLHGGDIHPHMGAGLQAGDLNRFSVLLEVESRTEADRIATGLSQGGKVSMPMQDSFWGSYFGMLSDAYGVEWMISCNAFQTA